VYLSVTSEEYYERIKVPALKRSHCDIKAFYKDKKYSGWVNCDFFISILERSLSKLGIREYIRLDQIPETVKIDTSGFLATVTIDI